MERNASGHGRGSALFFDALATVERIELSTLPFPWIATVSFEMSGKTCKARVRVPLRKRRVRLGGAHIAYVYASAAAGLKVGSQLEVRVCRPCPRLAFMAKPACAGCVA